jgi:glycosyltransferase involved in cell wall biosynthesis
MRLEDQDAQLLFVLEQSLGHVVHGENVEHAAEMMPNITARSIRIEYSEGGLTGRVPLLGGWSVRASRAARDAVLNVLREQRIDALLVHTWSAALLLGDVMRRVPTVLSTDATPINFDAIGASYGHSVSSRRIEHTKQLILRRVLSHAAAVTTWSQWAANSVESDYGVPRRNIKVIRPGVRLERFHPSSSHRDTSTTRLLFVGGDFKRKGGEDLLAAMACLPVDAELDVVTSRRPEQVPPRVRVHVGLGHDSPELFDLYQRADIFVMPTHGDAYGLVFAEAMACGLPVVACDVGAVSELVVHGSTGLLVEPGARDQLAAALTHLIRRPEVRRFMGERALATAHQAHDAQRTCHELVTLVRDVADVGRARAQDRSRSAPRSGL